MSENLDYENITTTIPLSLKQSNNFQRKVLKKNKDLQLSWPMWKGYLSQRRTVNTQTSLHILAVLPECLKFACIIYGIRGSFRQRATSLTPSKDLKPHHIKVPFLTRQLNYEINCSAGTVVAATLIWALSRENLSSGLRPGQTQTGLLSYTT